jgi:hypothetical protein
MADALVVFKENALESRGCAAGRQSPVKVDTFIPNGHP